VKQSRIIFLYDHFYPDFTAGGPITALGNLCKLVRGRLDFSIVTSNVEYKTKQVLPSITPNTWLTWQDMPVYYASSVFHATRVVLLFGGGTNTTLYLNGIFSWRYFLIPLLCAWIKRYEVIISPRGMLQSGALARHSLKKQIYLKLLRWSGLLRKSTWHATDEQERLDILNRITSKTSVVVIPDVPLVFQQGLSFAEKVPGQLRLVYFSLIAEKKNLLFALEVLNHPDLQHVSLDIIGPVKDKYYWEKCQLYIRSMRNSDRIRYRGEIRPEEVGTTLINYHAMILSTQGENFGHVIIEMLAAGRPVFISDKTPWKDLNIRNAGHSIPLNIDSWITAMVEASAWDQRTFDAICEGARNYYEQAFDFLQIKQRYEAMFSPSIDLKRSVVLTYDYFYPDFSAGGPIASLGNLTELLNGAMPLRILTSSYHYNKFQIMEGVALDQWTLWRGFPVWYASNAWSIVRTVLGFRSGSQTTFYLNGIFSIRYFLIPLMLSVWNGYRIIISPRGMLQEGAMKRGYFKKKLYISLIKLSGLLRHAVWHATDIQESDDIRARIGPGSEIHTISNVPMRPPTSQRAIVKSPGQLHLVYYSLISEKKNLNFLLTLLEHPSLFAVKLDIIGPVKDPSYWKKCQRTISLMKNPDRIRYLGELSPELTLDTLQKYHALVLPTLGENFGHAIVEMLSASRPVLISDKTPWNNIKPAEGGFAIPLEQIVWIRVLETMIRWSDNEFQIASAGALKFYFNSFNFEEMKSKYVHMFSNQLS